MENQKKTEPRRCTYCHGILKDGISHLHLTTSTDLATGKTVPYIPFGKKGNDVYPEFNLFNKGNY